jgi:hypothetical protein
MIQRISIGGLGPHEDTRLDLDPTGTTRISGPSESGKSFVLEAILFALCGRSSFGKLPADAIREGQARIVVNLELADGTKIRRGMGASGKHSRAVDGTAQSSEKKFVDALGGLGRDPEALHVVIAPMVWQDMVTGNARAFRDLLSRVLPGGNVAAEVARRMLDAGFVASESETKMTEKHVMTMRRDARKDRDIASGRRQVAEERVAAILATTDPIPAPVDPELLQRIAAWKAYDQLAASSGGQAVAAAAQTDWDARKSTLGPEPMPNPDHTHAADLARKAQQAIQAATQEYQGIQVNYQLVATQLQSASVSADPSVCPTCQRPGWEAGAQQAASLREQAVAFQTQGAAVQVRWQEASQQLQQAEAQLAEARKFKAQLSSWHQAHMALGERPKVPTAVDTPEPPVESRPSATETAEAASSRNALASLEGARQQRARDLTAAQLAVQNENNSFQTFSAEADRLELLLEAVRGAPSSVAASQAQALGDLGPVTLEFGDNPAVRVLIDGRPWWLASRGRQVVGDAYLRAGLRRAIAMPQLPIVIDNVQDVGGQPLPTLAGPVVLLETTNGTKLEVT